MFDSVFITYTGGCFIDMVDSTFSYYIMYKIFYVAWYVFRSLIQCN